MFVFVGWKYLMDEGFLRMVCVARRDLVRRDCEVRGMMAGWGGLFAILSWYCTTRLPIARGGDGNEAGRDRLTREAAPGGMPRERRCYNYNGRQCSL